MSDQPPDEKRMSQIAECLGRIVAQVAPDGVRYCLIVQDSKAWAVHSTVGAYPELPLTVLRAEVSQSASPSDKRLN